MPLPWRLNKHDKNSHTQTQTCARKSSHESKSYCHEIKRTNCVQPKGIIFNYNIQKGSTHTTNENKSITKENQNDNHTTILETNAENDDNSGVDDSNIKPNKMYKIVIVDGNIRLAEHDDDGIIEKSDEGNKDENDSDVEFIDTDDHVEVNKNNDGSLRKYEIPKEVNTGPEDETNLTLIKPMAPIKPMPIVSNQHDNSTVPIILNHNLQSVLPKTYTRKKGNGSVMKKLASINGQNSSKNNIHTTKKNLAEARSGKAMVLLPLQKYTTLKKKLTDIQKEKEKWIVLETKYKKEKIEAEKKIVKKNTIGVQTGRCHGEELEELNLLKARLAKIFTEAQINMISNSKKLRDIVWSDSEMEKVVFLKQIISQTAYVFLKYKMRFPLPPLSAVKQWMIKKNMYVTPNRNEKIQKPAKSKARVVGEEVNFDTTHIPLPLEPLNSNVHDETQDIHTLQTQTAMSETAEAVNSIIDDQRPQNVEFGSTLQVYSTLSGPTDAGEQFVYYTYENVNNENDANNANYMPDDNIATVEEIVQSEVVRPPKKTVAEATLRCRLCMRPFDTDQEVRQHVPLHYYNTYYTSYLDAVKPFVCEFCNESVKHRFDLVHHHRIHLGINSLKCWFPGCTYVGKNMGNLKSHHDCHKARSFKCAECGALFKTRKYMRQHAARGHAARALLRCALCRATCRTLYTYRKHMDSHQRPPRIKCVEAGCEESFYSRASLRKHVAGAHSAAARRYRCERCPRAHYAHEAQLNRHLQKHDTHKISHCVKCLKVFYDYGEFYTHYMEHKDAEHKCKCTCGQRFFTQEELEEHKLQCTFVSGDNAKKNKKRKLKSKDAGNTDQAITSNNRQTKRRRTIKVKTCSTEQNSVVHEKSYERNITVEQENNEKQISDENKTFEQDQQELIATEPVMSEEIKEKVITLQINNNQAVIKLANNYPSLTNNYTQQVTSTTDRQLQKYIVIPKRDQKVLTKSTNQQKVDANKGSQKQKVIANMGGQQQKVILNVGSQQQKIVTNAGSQQENGFPVSDNSVQKVISVPENHLQTLIVMPKHYQQNVNSMSENVSRNVISVPENNLQKVFAVSNEQRNNTSQENDSTPPGNQNNIVQVSPNEHKIKNILPENKQHYPKKLTPIAKGSALEKMIAMSTINKIISGPQGNYTKKVLALPVDSPLKKIITVSKNPVQKAVTESYNPVNTLIGDQDPFQTVTTDHEGPTKKVTNHYESPVMKVTSGYEISIKSVNVPKSSSITHHEGQAKNLVAAPESPLKKVITIPEMQCQSKLIPIANKNNQKILSSMPIDNQEKKVIKIIQTDSTTALKSINSNKVVQIPGTKRLHRVTGITRQQLVAALANRPKKLIPISNSINNNNNQTEQDNQVQESAVQPDMPILDY